MDSDHAPQRTGWFRDYVAHPEHGPLPGLLLVLTVVTGMVDAVSILALGHVFVANMTGNIVFIAFALAGAPEFSLAASLSALAGFVAGVLLAGQLLRVTGHRGLLLRNMAGVECALLLVAVVPLIAIGHPGALARDLVAFVIAIAMGGQNATVRAVAVPDFTTTVLTMALTGAIADARREGPRVVLRRSLAIVTMFAGAALGAVLVLRVDAAATVGLAAGLVAAVTVTIARASRGRASWHRVAPRT